MNKIWIATGKNRFENNWKNIELNWENLIEKFKKPIVTKETYAEYIAMSVEDQGNIKDVGGFVGGVINGGRRKSGSVTARYLVTLDIDFAGKDFWEDLSLLYDCEMVLYSTHKHSTEQPRYRLIIPLSREVMPDEYEAISRKIAGEIGIELFDQTTFQPERLMYWPSASKDAPYVFKHQKGSWLDSDFILQQYKDWTDSSQWPISEKTKLKIKNGIDKQEDPTAKGGIIGAFCKAYSIEAAIDKFLSEIYETHSDHKYTYLHGSTSAGMAVYEGLFSFSHHSTDPSSGRLCNAFDLVRIHLYGDKDKNMKEGTPSSKRPSYIAMADLISKDEEVKQIIINEKISNQGDPGKYFNVIPNPDETDEKAWMKKLDVDRKGNILSTINSAVMVLLHDKQLSGALSFDDLRKTAVVRKNLPWRNVNKMTRYWIDADDSALRNYMEIMYGIVNRNNIADALSVVMNMNKFHPVKEYLESLEWDGKYRVDTLLIDYLGSDDNQYTRNITRKTLVAAVARVYEPGCKFDHVLTLVGPQGAGKSRLVAKLAGEWYSDTFGNLQSKDAMENLQGVWIMEIGELAGLKKQEIETIKLFISKPEDRFRVAYGRRVESFARQCIFIATTNNTEFLQDPTGNRRFWPIAVKTSKSTIKQEEVDQVWAETCYLYTMGENLYLDDTMEAEAKEVQEDYTEHDDRKEGIVKYLETLIPASWQDMNLYDRISFMNGDNIMEKGVMLREWITIPEIWLEHARGKQTDMTPYNTKYIRNIMNKLPRWKQKMLNRKPYGHQRGWVKVDSVMELVI